MGIYNTKQVRFMTHKQIDDVITNILGKKVDWRLHSATGSYSLEPEHMLTNGTLNNLDFFHSSEYDPAHTPSKDFIMYVDYDEGFKIDYIEMDKILSFLREQKINELINGSQKKRK